MARRAKDPPVPGTVGKRWLRRSERKHRKRPDGEERQDSVASTLQIAIRPAALRALENRTRRNPSVLSAFSAFAVAAFSAPRLMARQARGIQGASGRLSRQTSQTADDAERAARYAEGAEGTACTRRPPSLQIQNNEKRGTATGMLLSRKAVPLISSRSTHQPSVQRPLRRVCAARAVCVICVCCSD